MLSLSANAQEQVLTEKVLSADLALQAAQVAIGACRVRGVPGIAVVILDSHGLDKIVWVGDRVGRDTLQAAYRKARLSLSGRPSSQPAVIRVRPPRDVQQRFPQNPGNLDAGGVPIKMGDETVAAMGVAGSSTLDEYCANAGLDWIAEGLK